MAEPSKHTVRFDDTPGNWLAWGKLVAGWVKDDTTRPHKIKDLETQMDDAGITGIILAGTPKPNPDPNRPVDVKTYNNLPPGPITIPVPTQAMVDADTAYLNGLGNAPYPVPWFYSLIFSGAPVVFSPAMLLEMQKCRLGEYVINECM